MNFLNSVEAFLRVVELGSFTKAAEALSVTRGMISAHVSELEKEFGVRLLYRTTRKLGLTDEGSRIHIRLKRIAQEIDETRVAFLTPAKLTGAVRVVTGTLVINYLMLPLVDEFAARCPGITLEFLESHMLRGAKGEERDLTIRYGPFEDSTLVARPLGTTRLVVVGSKDYLARHGMPGRPEDLLSHRCCGLIDPGSGQLTEWTLQDGKSGEFKFFPRHTLRFSNTASLLDAARKGLGLAFVAELFAQEAIDQGLMLRVLPDHGFPYEGPCVLYKRDQLMPARVRAFLDFLSEKYPPHEPVLNTYRKLRGDLALAQIR